MAKPIILADDPEPEPPAEPPLYVIRYTRGPTDHSVLCEHGGRLKFFSDRPEVMKVYQDIDLAHVDLRMKLAESRADYEIELLDDLPPTFLARVRATNPYFKETP